MVHSQNVLGGYAKYDRFANMKTFQQVQSRRHDDEVRKTKIDGMLKRLMDSDVKRINRMVDEIIVEHRKLTGTDGFYHKGQIYGNVMGVSQSSPAMQKQPIHESLRERMFEYDRQLAELVKDRDILRQGLGVLIRRANTPQEIRNALPDLLLPVMDSPEHLLDRTEPEMHTLTSQIHRIQYERTLDKIYFYLGSRLLG